MSAAALGQAVPVPGDADHERGEARAMPTSGRRGVCRTGRQEWHVTRTVSVEPALSRARAGSLCLTSVETRLPLAEGGTK